MTQGKIERYHRSMKNSVLLQNKYYLSELEKVLAQFVEYYTNEHYNESLENFTPADIYFGKVEQELAIREENNLKNFQQ